MLLFLFSKLSASKHPNNMQLSDPKKLNPINSHPPLKKVYFHTFIAAGKKNLLTTLARTSLPSGKFTSAKEDF